MKLEGIIVDVIFKNEENGYLIANLESENEIITIVGYMPFVGNGENLEVEGDFVEHKQYGKQFKVETFKKKLPETESSLQRYLVNLNIKGVGEVTAKKIVARFGLDTINILRFSPEKLALIKGITNKRAYEISEGFLQNWEIWQIVEFLEEFGIGVDNAKKVYDEFGQDSIEKIQNNPYVLVDLVRNVDFRKIDNVAINMGVEENNLNRIISAIKYIIVLSIDNGNSCIVKEELIRFAKKLINVEENIIYEAIIELVKQKELVVEERDDLDWVYLADFYEIEAEIAIRIVNLENGGNIKKLKDLDKKLEEFEKKYDIKLSKKQRKAIEVISENNVTIITGGPGTGKTTIIKTIIELYEQINKKVVLAAPTGMAAKKMTEATGKKASTLHRLLNITKIDDDETYYKKEKFQGQPIDADIIVIDEVSMVDMFIMNYLLKSIYKGTKLILVGDVDQLSSVGPGSVLKDLINSNKINVVKLNKIFRQAAQSKIIVNAHRVNNGERFLDKSEYEQDMKEDFFFIKKNSSEEILKEVISLCTGRLSKYSNYDFFKNIQVLTPTKKGILGTRELNKILQEELNPYDEVKKQKAGTNIIYRVGDRIMQIKNSYDMPWEKESTYESNNIFLKNKVKKELGRGVFNGEMGTIEDIDLNEKTIKIKFDDEKIVFYDWEELEQIEHSYAITVHKSQGSEFDVVIMVVPQTAPMLLNRNLLYTGITRAREMLIIIANDAVLQYMIKNVDIKKRDTGLEFKIREYYDNNK